MSKYLDDFENLFIEAIKELSLKKQKRLESGGFGDGYILYHNNDFAIRLVSDRGLPFIEIGSKSSALNWYDLSLICNYMNKLDLLHNNEIADQIIFLRTNSKLIADMFRSKNKETMHILQQLQEERAVRSIDRLQTGDVQEYWKTGKIDKFR